MYLSFGILFGVLACLASAADQFNITTCYCHGEYRLDGGPNIYTETGNFIGFDYWNRHLDRTYSFNITQRATAYIHEAKGNQKEAQPKLDKTCTMYEGHYELCYWRKQIQLRGRYSFNNHKRILHFPGPHPDYSLRKKAFRVCQERCSLDVGLPNMDGELSNYMSYELRGICKHHAEGVCPWPAKWAEAYDDPSKHRDKDEEKDKHDQD